jgi:hypothetical protein
MSEAILAAINRMDPENDNHWTIDGLAKLDTIKFLAGQPVTREELETIAPGFNRESLRAYRQGAGNEQAPAPAPAPDPAGVAADPVPPAPEGATSAEPADGEAEIETLAKEIAEQEQAILELQRVQDKAGTELKDRAFKLDSLRLRHDKLIPPETDGQVIQKYLARQRELNEKRGLAMKAIRESGVDLKVLTKAIAGSPLDVALKTRGKPKRE